MDADTDPDLLVPFGWDDRRRAWWAAAPAGAVPGRVIRADRGRLAVQTPTGVVAATDNPAGWPGDAEDRTPTTGDWVALADPDPDAVSTVLGVMPRSAAITRLDAAGRAEQVLAANVDLVAIVHGLDRPLKAGRLERSLVLAWESGAVPVVVLTKVDLVDLPTLGALTAEVAGLAPGVDVLAVGARSDEGIEALAALLADHRSAVMLGESGAGKSTLVNALMGREVQATGDVRAGDAKGRHTTVRRELLLVPGGGVVIDTPGLRGIGLWDSDTGLGLAFPDIEERAQQCRFRDCRHDAEPGCAVKQAADRGELDPDRLARYRALADEGDATDARREAATQREEKRQDKPSQRALRASSQNRAKPRG